MSKEEVIAAIKKATEELGHVPSQTELLNMTKLTKHWLRKYFGGYKGALAAGGLTRGGSGYSLNLKCLFLDWAGVVRQVGTVPSMTQYDLHGKYSTGPLVRYFGGWVHVPAGLLTYARSEGMEEEWRDVLELVALHPEAQPRGARNSVRTGFPPGRVKASGTQRIYGAPMARTPMVFEPTNEAGVAVLFGAVHRELGFAILHVQNGFPDCEAMREVEPGRCQRKKIEFEFQSRNFLAHLHPLDGCDLIVCWEDNWPDAPIEVLELKSAVEELMREGRFQRCQGCQNRRK